MQPRGSVAGLHVFGFLVISPSRFFCKSKNISTASINFLINRTACQNADAMFWLNLMRKDESFAFYQLGALGRRWRWRVFYLPLRCVSARPMWNDGSTFFR
jgi:hypothetical protein